MISGECLSPIEIFAADESEVGDSPLCTVGTTEAVMAVLAVHKK
jgi:hypothetical protein